MKNSNSPSRRDFLKRVSLATAGLAAGVHLQPRKASARNEDKRLGVALLGLGRYSSGQLGPALLETKKCYLAGVVTGHPEKAEKWAATYNLKKKNLYNYENMEQMADNPEIDIVYEAEVEALQAADGHFRSVRERPPQSTLMPASLMNAP
jgi:hypothetical protein